MLRDRSSEIQKQQVVEEMQKLRCSSPPSPDQNCSKHHPEKEKPSAAPEASHMVIENHRGKRPQTRDHPGQGAKCRPDPTSIIHRNTLQKPKTDPPEKCFSWPKELPKTDKKRHTHTHDCNSTSRQEATKPQNPKKPLTQVHVSGLSNPKAPQPMNSLHHHKNTQASLPSPRIPPSHA